MLHGSSSIPENQSHHRTLIAAVIVVYKPDPKKLEQLVDAIKPQISRLFIIHNGNEDELKFVKNDIILTIKNIGENIGLASAQNEGIKLAIAEGSSHIIILDQDSLPAHDMVHELQYSLNVLQENNIPVAAIGPHYFDERQGIPQPFIYRSGSKLLERIREKNQYYVETDFLIASGCLIPSSMFTKVGLMQSDLFIDYVDIEWGLRAKYAGYKCFGSYSARMLHSLGDDWLQVKGRTLPIHSPLRNYYQFRNAIWLTRQEWIDNRWRKIFLTQLVKQLILWTAFLPHRWLRARLILKGIYHGITGRSGKL